MILETELTENGILLETERRLVEKDSQGVRVVGHRSFGNQGIAAAKYRHVALKL